MQNNADLYCAQDWFALQPKTRAIIDALLVTTNLGDPLLMTPTVHGLSRLKCTWNSLSAKLREKLRFDLVTINTDDQITRHGDFGTDLGVIMQSLGRIHAPYDVLPRKIVEHNISFLLKRNWDVHQVSNCVVRALDKIVEFFNFALLLHRKRQETFAVCRKVGWMTKNNNCHNS